MYQYRERNADSNMFIAYCFRINTSERVSVDATPQIKILSLTASKMDIL